MKPTPMLVAADVVLLGESPRGEKSVLLIQRKNPPFQFCWALPGGFVDPEEDVPQAAKRELKEETNLEIAELKLVGVYSKPDRDERGRVISIAFTASVNIEDFEPKAMDDAMNIGWFLLDELPPLAFDHAQIISDAKKVNKL